MYYIRQYVHEVTRQTTLLQDHSCQKIHSIHQGKKVDLSSRVQDVQSSPSQNIVKKGLEIHRKATNTGDHEIAHEEERNILRNLVDKHIELLAMDPLYEIKQASDRVSRHLPPPYRVYYGQNYTSD